MKFFEKDLESLIFDDYMGCQAKGLSIKSERFINGCRLRQLNLGPFGVADLVNITYDPAKHRVQAQIIECKRGRIDASTYLQAKRYEIGLGFWLSSLHDFNIHVIADIETVLIGDSFSADGPVGLVAGLDHSTSMFLFKYGLDGIVFEDITTWWYMQHENYTPDDISPKQLEALAKNLKSNYGYCFTSDRPVV